MKHARAGRFLLALLFLFSAAAVADTLQGRVVRVVDGDTVVLLAPDKTQHRIRLAGIDAPERGQAFGTVSTRHLSELVDYSKRDRYGRIVGKELVEGQDANLRQVEAGLAWHYKQYAREQSPEDRRLYAEAEDAARALGRGLWRDDGAVPPWEYRRIKLEERGGRS